MLADVIGFGVVAYRVPRSYGDVLAEFPESVRNHFPPDAKELTSELFAEIKVIESV
jgi:hypothetical protein